MTAPENNELRDRPTGDLLKELSDQTTTLVRQEIALAKAELGEKGKTAGLGAFAALTACIIAALDSAMPLWLAALIPAVVYAAVAGLLALRGRDKVREAAPPVPEQATESVKEDVQWAKTRARSGRT